MTLVQRLNQSRTSAVLQANLIAIKLGTAEARRLNLDPSPPPPPPHLGPTVPGKGTLTVSTRNSILDPRSFWESSIEARVSRFEFRGSSFGTLEEFFENLD